MKSRLFKPFIWLSIFMIVVSLACNASSTPTAAPTLTPQPPPPTREVEPVVKTEEPVQTQEPVKTEEPAPQDDGSVSSLGDVEKAVVLIEAEGTFVDPEVGWTVNAGHYGTGFIIDPSGIAVTNNHVVTGAALLRIWFPGDDRPKNAKVLGVSECSDLAVIDIEGDGYPYLKWFDGDITVGLKIYAAGYPLADPNFTLTDGIVSKAEASGETSWASVDFVIEHSAKINPGNSGGPLVTEDGLVVGVNYAVVSDTDQNYAISRDEANEVIDQLRAGKDIDTIGVNGGAVSGTVGDTPIYGVWVRSIESGSPADKARILPGDIIFMLENNVVGLDGTMADYCDILRSRNASDTMSVTVVRWSDLSTYEGQLNGRELEYIGQYADTTVDNNGNTNTGGDNSLGDGYAYYYDDTGTIYAEVPDYWVDYNGGQWTWGDDVIGVAISAAPSLSDFNDYWDAEGVFFGASDTFANIGGYVQFLDYYTEDYSGGCKLGGRYDYNDGLYRGKYDYYYNCGGAGGYDAYVLSAVSIENQGAYIILIEIQVPKGVTDVVDRIWNTFLVGDL